jgi:acetyl esterase/lipase
MRQIRLAPRRETLGLMGVHHRFPDARAARCRYRAALERLESRELLAGGVGHGVGVPPPTSEYYADVVPAPKPALTVTPGSIWDDATFWQYGPAADQQLWVLVPPDPNGKLDLIVHSGGFRRGSPSEAGVYGQFDLARGTTVVSIGYRLLGQSAWPAPVDDVAEGIDQGVRLVQTLTGNRISDITETGLSAGGTALALINYSDRYPTTAVQPNRIITVSAPLEEDAVSPARRDDRFRYTEALRWSRIVPTSKVPITLMGTPGDPIAIERGQTSNVRQFARYLQKYDIGVKTYFDPHDPGHHGSVTVDLPQYPDVAAAFGRAEGFVG